MKITSKQFVDTSSSEPEGPTPTAPHVSIKAATTNDNMDKEGSTPDLGTDNGSMGMNTLDVTDKAPHNTSNNNNNNNNMTGVATSIPQSSMEVALMDQVPSTRRRPTHGEYLF
jgi:hypothetical protein